MNRIRKTVLLPFAGVVASMAFYGVHTPVFSAERDYEPPMAVMSNVNQAEGYDSIQDVAMFSAVKESIPEDDFEISSDSTFTDLNDIAPASGKHSFAMPNTGIGEEIF